MSESDLHPDNFDHFEMARDIIRDNPVLTGKICLSAEVKMADVLPLLSETVRFLNLIAYQEAQLTPSIKIDLAWHELILCTHFYQTWCDQHWHRYIHHNPGGDPNQHQRNFSTTIKLYRKYFGILPTEYWGHLGGADCGNCSSINEEI